MFWRPILSSMRLALLFPAFAYAQTIPGYSITYSGGTATATNPRTSIPTGYKTDTASATYTGQAASWVKNGTSGTAKCSGQLTATCQWNGGSGNAPVPPSVIIQQDSGANWSVTEECPCTADDGQGDNIASTGSVYPLYGTCSRTTFSVVNTPSNPLPENCSPNSTASSGVSFIQTNVSYKVTAYPVTIALGGVNSANQALTGQQITATLTGIPSAVTDVHNNSVPIKITSYTWSFAGNTAPSPIKTWNENGTAADGKTPQQLFPLLPADLTQTDTTGNGLSVTPIKFYDLAGDSTFVVKCAVGLKFPDGTTHTVTAKSPTINFMKPTASLTAIGTAVIDDPADQRFGGGELWTNIAITVPSPFIGGSGCLCQIVTPVRSITRVPQNGKTTSTYYNKVQNPPGSNTWVQQGKGLDTYFPYQNEISLNADGSTNIVFHPQGYIWDVSVSGSSADDPYQEYTTTDLDSGGNDWRTSKASDSFTTWVMYKPNFTNAIWVPLQTVAWSWTGTATKNTTTGVWSTIGSVTTDAKGTVANDPPQWTSIVIAKCLNLNKLN